MRFVAEPPKLVGKGCYGVWRVKACYSNGSINERNYVAYTSNEAKVMYFREYGKVCGTISAEFVSRLY